MDEPFYLPVGTPVSAKYRGAFCEATIEKVDKQLNCRIQYKDSKAFASVQFQDLTPPSADAVETSGSYKFQINDEVLVRGQNGSQYPAIIHKISDHSSYYVVFDDGDKRTLKRTQLVLKGDRHFKESESLDRLPLTNPEQFKNPVIYSSRRKTRCNDGELESEDEESDSQDDTSLDLLPRRTKESEPLLPNRQAKLKTFEKKKNAIVSKNSSVVTEYPSRFMPLVGQLVLINLPNSTPYSNDKKRTFPALIVTASASWDTPLKHSQLLVKSFKDNKFYAVSKRDFEALSREQAIKIAQSNKALRLSIEKAVLWIDNQELPPTWDKENLLGESTNNASGGESNTKSRDSDRQKNQENDEKMDEEDKDESSDEDVDLEEKDHWLAMLYEFMEDSGCPMNKAPSLANKDLDLYKLHKLVKKFGGYSRVTSQMKWPLVYSKMSLPSAPAAARHIQSAYKKYLLPFDEMNRKLGSSFHLQLFTSRRGSHSARERRNSGIMQHYNQQLQVKVASPPANNATTPATTTTTATKELISPLSSDGKLPPVISPETKTSKPRPKQPPTLVKEVSCETAKILKESDSSESEKQKSRKRKATSALLPISSNDKTNSSDEARTRSTRLKRVCNEEDTLSVSSRSSCSAATSSLSKQKHGGLRSDDPVLDIWQDGLPVVGCRVGVKYGISGNTMYEAKVVQILEKKLSESSVEGGDVEELMVVVHYVGWHHRHDETVPLNRIVHLQGDTSGMINLTKPSFFTNSLKCQTSTTTTPPVVQPKLFEMSTPSPPAVKDPPTEEKFSNNKEAATPDNSKHKNLDDISSTASSCNTSTKTLRNTRRLRRDVTLHQCDANEMESTRQDESDKQPELDPIDPETCSDVDKNDSKHNKPSSSTRRGTRSQQSDSEPNRSPVQLRNSQRKKSPSKAISQNSTPLHSEERINSVSCSEEEEVEMTSIDVKEESSSVSSMKRQKRSCVIKREVTESSSVSTNQKEEIEAPLTPTESQIKESCEVTVSITETPLTIDPSVTDNIQSGPTTRNKLLVSPGLESPVKEESHVKSQSVMSNSDCESTATCSTVHMLGQDTKLEQDVLDLCHETLVTSMPSPTFAAAGANTSPPVSTVVSPQGVTTRCGRRGRVTRGNWRRRNASQTDSSRTIETPRRQESEDPEYSNDATDASSSRPPLSNKRTRRQAWNNATSTPRNAVCPAASANNSHWLESQNLTVLASTSPNITGGCRDGNESLLSYPSPSIERNSFVRNPDRPFVRLHPDFYPTDLESMPNAEERVAALEVALRKVNEAWRKTKQELRDVERRRLKKKAKFRSLANSASAAMFGGASSSSCVNSASPVSGEAGDTSVTKPELFSVKDVSSSGADNEGVSNSVVTVQS